MSSQHDGAAVIVGDHVGSSKVPVLKQIVQQLALDIEGNRVLRVLDERP